MKAVQFDKNNGDLRIIKACNIEGHVQCHRHPRALDNASDDVVLGSIIERDRLLVTFARNIASEWSYVLANGFPGILIVALDDNDTRKITTQIAGRILRDFKRDFSIWHEVPWSNSVIELQPRHIYVNRVDGSVVVATKWIDRATPDWQGTLQACLQQNSLLHPRPHIEKREST